MSDFARAASLRTRRLPVAAVGCVNRRSPLSSAFVLAAHSKDQGHNVDPDQPRLTRSNMRLALGDQIFTERPSSDQQSMHDECKMRQTTLTQMEFVNIHPQQDHEFGYIEFDEHCPKKRRRTGRSSSGLPMKGIPSSRRTDTRNTRSYSSPGKNGLEHSEQAKGSESTFRSLSPLRDLTQQSCDARSCQTSMPPPSTVPRTPSRRIRTVVPSSQSPEVTPLTVRNFNILRRPERSPLKERSTNIHTRCPESPGNGKGLAKLEIKDTNAFDSSEMLGLSASQWMRDELDEEPTVLRLDTPTGTPRKSINTQWQLGGLYGARTRSQASKCDDTVPADDSPSPEKVVNGASELPGCRSVQAGSRPESHATNIPSSQASTQDMPQQYDFGVTTVQPQVRQKSMTSMEETSTSRLQQQNLSTSLQRGQVSSSQATTVDYLSSDPEDLDDRASPTPRRVSPANQRKQRSACKDRHFSPQHFMGRQSSIPELTDSQLLPDSLVNWEIYRPPEGSQSSLLSVSADDEQEGAPCSRIVPPNLQPVGRLERELITKEDHPEISKNVKEESANTEQQTSPLPKVKIETELASQPFPALSSPKVKLEPALDKTQEIPIPGKRGKRKRSARGKKSYRPKEEK